MKKTPNIIGKSALIWLTTNLAGGILLFLYYVSASYHDSGISIIVALFGLLFSAPVIGILIPALHLLKAINSKAGRIVYSIFLVPCLCAFVILLVQLVFGFSILEDIEIQIFFIPYIIAAEICFFLFTYKMINGTAEAIASDTAPLDSPHIQ